MLTGDRLSEKTLLNFVAEDAARLTMKNIRKVLVSGDYYTIAELEDTDELGGLSKYDLVVRAIRENGSWNLLESFHEIREFSDQTIAALSEDGIVLGDGEEPVEDKESSPSAGNPSNVNISAPIREKLKQFSDRVTKLRGDYRGIFWLLGVPLVILGGVWIVIQIAMAVTGSDNIPELLGLETVTPAPSLTPTQLASATSLPTNSPSPTDTLPATPTKAPSPSQTAFPSSTAQALEEAPSIAISEIMFVPQPPFGDEGLESWNEYVEILNYGDEPIDVSGWWISDGGVTGNPDRLISWNERLPNIEVGDAIIDTTVIPAGSYALILSIKYDEGDRPYDDLVNADTIILTLADDSASESELIGKDGLSATGEFLDVLVLYVGTGDEIQMYVSTYGSPKWDGNGTTTSIRDDGLDTIPRAITAGWGGFRRGISNGADTRSNWSRFTWDDKSPGY